MTHTLTDEQIRTAHATADRDTLRTTALRSAIEADAYLSTAKDATDDGNTRVAAEYIERATRQLERTIEALRNLR